MLIIGLMLIRNENDILREVLAEHFKFSDHIFVLDGTTEDSKLSKEICQSFENISHYTENQLPSHYPHPIRDGCRQFLVERAREKFGAQGWFVILHGDDKKI
jgi:calcineurin-like phosphoesterase family protein